MTHMRTSPKHLLTSNTLVGLLTCAAVLAAVAVARAQVATVVPVAPPEGVELVYDIPLQPWLASTVLDLKVQFADGLSDEFNGIAENQTGGDLTALVEAGRELGDSTARMLAAVRAIGERDVTFGIYGISRIIPAESAIRDTLFGFVVWHEHSSGPARGMMQRFEGLVGHVAAGGEASADLAAELAVAQEQLEQAVAQGNSDRIAELSPGIIETSRRIDAVCGTVAAGAQELGALIDSLSANSGELLADRWAEASRTTAVAGEPAQRTGPALESMSGVLHLLIEIGGVLEVAVTSVDALSAAPEADGNLYIPWTVMRGDWVLARDLRDRVLEESAAPAVTDQAKVRIRALFVNYVEANAILAERAIEHTSTLVAEASDTLEDRYLDREGYSDNLSDRRKKKVVEQVDRSLRESMEFMSAKM
ncbi:MAG: hypothetical protein KAW67_05615, partial [Candidatus Eisenbacteria sp.]|nr:hypothetical protein [Candidatus Eisenbacteria bacterium]